MNLFISYSHDDVDFARRLRDELRRWQHDTWLDYDNIAQGAYWPDAIDDGLRECDAVIGVMTAESVASRNVKNEWDWALTNGKPLLLVLLRPCEIPHRYVSINYLDFTAGESFGALREALSQPLKIDDDDAPLTAQQPLKPTHSANRNRLRMLEKVKTFWIKGVLESSLHGAALIELGMEGRPEAVERPWEMVLQHADYPDYRLEAQVSVSRIFADVGGELLILGEPGAGKTTTMLELARDLIEAAQADSNAPLPVVFNLSSWADQRQSVAEWMVSELNARYQVPRHVGTEWVTHEQILPLLDGLDEVASAHRSACVDAINDFRRQHGLVPLVVCSRVKDYDALNKRLKLQGAVLLQPLTFAQVDAYLAQAGAELSVLRSALQADATLQELAQTPLMLSIIMLAYRGASAQMLPLATSTSEGQRRLFEAYIARMFTRRNSDRYPRDKTLHWLSWLAGQMKTQAQTVFLIERLQPAWLPNRAWRSAYLLLAWMVVGLPVGIPLAIPFLITGQVGMALLTAVGITALTGMIVGPIADIAYRTPGAQVRIVEVLGWSWRSALKGTGSGLGIGSLVGGMIVLVNPSPLPLLPVMLGGALAFGLVGSMAGGLYSDEVELRTLPNQGIRRSALNALRIGVPIGLAGVIAGTFTLRLAGILIFELDVEYVRLLFTTQMTFELLFGLLAGLALGMAFGLFFGGFAVLRHGLLRLMLWLSGAMPWNYARFLDFACDLIFMRRVGGSYIFLHRLLLDYFAALDEPE